eukprot:1765701-Pyramimonas_sp.AAC.1
MSGAEAGSHRPRPQTLFGVKVAVCLVVSIDDSGFPQALFTFVTEFRGCDKLERSYTWSLRCFLIESSGQMVTSLKPIIVAVAPLGDDVFQLWPPTKQTNKRAKRNNWGS